MSNDNGELHGLWPHEDDVVPMSAMTAVATGSSNGASSRSVIHDPSVVRSSHLTAGEFTPERMIRYPATAPAGGWRRAIFLPSFGHSPPLGLTRRMTNECFTLLM